MRFRLGAVLLLLSALLSAFLPAPARAGRQQLTIGISQFPPSFHPSIESMLARSYVLGFARRPITVYDPSWTLVCMLCVELPTLANGGAKLETTPDGKPGLAVTFTLKPDLRWGDGVPITTKDVLFTWEVGRHPQSGVIPKELYRSIYKIDVADPHTFTLHFDKRPFDYNDINSFELLPEHVERDAFAEPAAYPTRTRFATDPTNKGLYNGPYLIDEVVAGSQVVLVRNPYWTGPAPAFPRIVVRAIENTAALEANLLSGAIDMIAGEVGLSIDQALSLQKRQGSRFQFIFKPGLIYEHIDLNLDNPVLADRRVRQALLYGIDRQKLVDTLFAGHQPVADSPVSPLDPLHADDIRHYAYDPAQAAKLLTDAGWEQKGPGPRRNAAGQPLQLEIMTTAGDRTRELVEQVLQSDWKALGIDVSIRNQPARVFFGDTVSKRRFPGMALFAWYSAPQSVPRTTLHSDQIPTADNAWAGQNYTGFHSAEMDNLIEAAEVELDDGKRKALMARLQQIYADELPALPLFYRANAYVLPLWLDGVRPTGHQYPSTLWAEEWREK